MNGHPYLVACAVLALVACSGGAPVSAPADGRSAGREVPAELRVPEPKDARGIPPCELLSHDELVGLGLDPESAVRRNSEFADGCTWRYADGSTSASIAVATEQGSRNLADLYLLRDTFARFEPTEVAGHPAVRTDNVEQAICTLSVAIADDQGMAVEARLSGPPPPDPCAPSRRMAELILSNLPPLN